MASYLDYAYNVQEGQTVEFDGSCVTVDGVRCTEQGTWLTYNNDTASRCFKMHEMVRVHF